MGTDNTVRILLTKYRAHTVCARFVGFRMTDLIVITTDERFHVGDIIIGKVSTVKKQINAAFVSLGEGPDAYLSLDDPHRILYTHGNPDTPLSPGDEILVQVTKEPHDLKSYTVSANLMFPGRNVLIMTGKTSLGISAKIPDGRKKELRNLLAPLMPAGYGVIVRSAAESASVIEITEELDALTLSVEEKLMRWKTRTCFSVTEQGKGETEKFILEHLRSGIHEIVTDLPGEFQKLQQITGSSEQLGQIPVRLYDSSQISLSAVYSLDAQITKALSKNVYLPSGAWICIEQTEAMTVIDVNSGKAAAPSRRSESSKEKVLLRVNAEAAHEIARQIRLRNLSGIIVTDFIDLADDKDRQAVLQILRDDTADDPAGVHVVDMTALQLCEMTRKRTKRTLSEQLSLDGGV